MNLASEFAVTLDPELFERLSVEARLLGVPLEWVVASLVADTYAFEEPAEGVAV